MENTSPTFESVWAALQESNRILTEKQAETDRLLKEVGEQQTETDRILRESRTETDRILTEKFTDLTHKQADTDRLIKDLAKQVGGVSSSNGLFAEDYFFNSFKEGQNHFFGETFDGVEKNLKNHWQGLTDEYDIVMYNHDSAAIVEVKYRARITDIPDVLKKPNTFRILFPNYQHFKFYLGLASMSFDSIVEDECKKQGIAIIKQVGEKVVIYDENLKTF